MSASGTPSSQPSTWFGRFISGIQNFVTHEAFPFLENLFKTTLMDEISALAPMAEAAVEQIAADLPLLLSQGTEGFLKAFNGVVASTKQSAEAAALTVADHSIITASQAALVNWQAKQKAG